MSDFQQPEAPRESWFTVDPRIAIEVKYPPVGVILSNTEDFPRQRHFMNRLNLPMVEWRVWGLGFDVQFGRSFYGVTIKFLCVEWTIGWWV